MLSAVDEFGLGKWKEVSERVGTGRTDNTVSFVDIYRVNSNSKQCRYRYDTLKSRGSSDIVCDASEAQMVAPVTKEPSSSKPRQRKRKGVSAVFLWPRPTGFDTNDIQTEDTSREPQSQTSSGRKRPGTQAKTGEPETETMESDAVQSGVDPQPLPAGNSKNVRPRARPLKRAKSQAQVTSDFPPQPQIQPAASGAAAVGAVESVHASPPTQGVENEGSHEDTVRLPQRRPNPTLHPLDHADKRQKTSDQVQSEEVAETMNHSANVDAAAKGDYILMAFQRLATQTY